jgi:hypothetical protein
VLDREIEKGGVCTDARIRDDDVDATEAVGGRVAEGNERVQVADVARLSDDALEAEVVPAARCETEVAAAVVQHPRDGGSDAAARARDHSSLAFEAHCSSFRVG